MGKCVRPFTLMAKPRYDWRLIRDRYTTSPEAISKTDLADEFGICRQTLQTRASKEQWDFQRDRFLVRLSEQTMEKKAEVVANEGKVFDSDSLKFAKKGMALADKFLDEKGLDPRVMKDVLTAGRTAQQIAKDALGDKPETTVTIDGKVTVSLEDVTKDYADLIREDNSSLPTTNGPQ